MTCPQPPRLSVIIPTYNKRAVLEETLQALTGQVLDGGFEIIVVDDGSTDGTLQWLEQAKSSWQSECAFPIAVLPRSRGGAAAARNAGAAMASGDLLLFLDADIVASPGLLAEHCAHHERYRNALVLGRVCSPPSGIVGNACYLFGDTYFLGEEERELSPRCGISQNMSIEAADFRAFAGLDTLRGKAAATEHGSQQAGTIGFDSRFPRGQDIEFAYRLASRGMVLRYCPQAIAVHNHALSLNQICRKTREDHRLLCELFVRHPEILRDMDYLEDKLPLDFRCDPIRLLLRKVWRLGLATLPARAVLYFACSALDRSKRSLRVLDFLMWKLIGAHQLMGLRAGMRQLGWKPNVRRRQR